MHLLRQNDSKPLGKPSTKLHLATRRQVTLGGMASQLPFPGDWEGTNEVVLVLPPPLVIPPDQPPPAELEAGIEGFSPDRLLQQTNRSPPRSTSVKTLSVLQPPLLPPPPSLRRVYRSCRRRKLSSDPKEEHRARQQYKRCIGSGLRCACCLFAAGVAILIAYWSLFPFCTNCHSLSVWSISSSSSSAVEIAALDGAVESVQPFSTLRINQLQVCLLGTSKCYQREVKTKFFAPCSVYICMCHASSIALV